MAYVGRTLLEVARHRLVESPSRLGTVLVGAAAHDWMLFGHLVVLLGLSLKGHGPTRLLAVTLLALSAAWFAGAVTAARSSPATSTLRSAFYRASLIGVPLAVYLQLRWVLPVIAPQSVDAELLAFDLRFFGVEPALAWDAYVAPPLTEWFSFFYSSYFFVLGAFAIPIALSFEDGPPLREFAFGVLFLFCVGHVTYAIVPAFGPHAHVAPFEHALTGPTFWPFVQNAVEEAGAGKDVFPSLHTAAPVFLTLYAFRHRRIAVLRWAAPVVGFVASQIVIATMYLRWHYLVDVVAGVALAVLAFLLARSVTAWEASRRRAADLPPVFPPPPRWPCMTSAGARRRE